MLTGIVKVLRLPPQCTFWRFLASLHLGIAQQLLGVQRRMRGMCCIFVEQDGAPLKSQPRGGYAATPKS
jgi:hypothetical protein